MEGTLSMTDEFGKAVAYLASNDYEAGSIAITPGSFVAMDVRRVPAPPPTNLDYLKEVAKIASAASAFLALPNALPLLKDGVSKVAQLMSKTKRLR